MDLLAKIPLLAVLSNKMIFSYVQLLEASQLCFPLALAARWTKKCDTYFEDIYKEMLPE